MDNSIMILSEGFVVIWSPSRFAVLAYPATNTKFREEGRGAGKVGQPMCG